VPVTAAGPTTSLPVRGSAVAVTGDVVPPAGPDVPVIPAAPVLPAVAAVVSGVADVVAALAEVPATLAEAATPVTPATAAGGAATSVPFTSPELVSLVEPAVPAIAAEVAPPQMPSTAAATVAVEPSGLVPTAVRRLAPQWLIFMLIEKTPSGPTGAEPTASSLSLTVTVLPAEKPPEVNDTDWPWTHLLALTDGGTTGCCPYSGPDHAKAGASAATTRPRPMVPTKHQRNMFSPMYPGHSALRGLGVYRLGTLVALS
jgi:hypothetical protein